jgi:hypothetical protein
MGVTNAREVDTPDRATDTVPRIVVVVPLQ